MQNVDFFDLLELHFTGLKSIVFYPEYKKNVSFWVFFAKKNI